MSYKFCVLLSSGLLVFLSMGFLRKALIGSDADTGGVSSPNPCLGGVFPGLMLAFAGGDCTEIHIP